MMSDHTALLHGSQPLKWNIPKSSITSLCRGQHPFHICNHFKFLNLFFFFPPQHCLRLMLLSTADFVSKHLSLQRFFSPLKIQNAPIMSTTITKASNTRADPSTNHWFPLVLHMLRSEWFQSLIENVIRKRTDDKNPKPLQKKGYAAPGSPVY